MQYTQHTNQTQCYHFVLIKQLIFYIKKTLAAFNWYHGSSLRQIFKLFFQHFTLSVLGGHSVFSSQLQRPMTSIFEGFQSQISSITFLSYLNSSKRDIFSLFNVECQTRELRVPFLRLWYDEVRYLGWNPGPSALDASTLSLGY